jgi:hypothetical protein
VHSLVKELKLIAKMHGEHNVIYIYIYIYIHPAQN